MIRDLVPGRGQVHATRHGRPVADEAYDCGTDTRFCFFSAGKPVTATAIHLLVADGVLTYDDPVAHWVPEFGSHGKDAVTVHHVLLHQGGFPDSGITRVPPGPDAVAAVCDLPLEFEPGTRTVYSPLTGYAMLAEVAARASGTTFPDLCAQRIFVPLGMDRTTWGLPDDLLDEAAHPRSDDPALEAIAARMRAPDVRRAVVPGGGLWSTARDMGRFYEAWLDERLLPDAIRELATSRLGPGLVEGGRTALGYGFTVGADTTRPFARGHRASDRSFGFQGFACAHAWADPAAGIAAAAVWDTAVPDHNERHQAIADLIHTSV